MSSDPDFIELYPDAIDRETARSLLAAFDRPGSATRGVVGSGVDLDIKDSWDIGLTGRAEWRAEVEKLNGVVLRRMIDYVRKYTHLALGPFALREHDPTAETTTLLDPEEVSKYDPPRLAALISRLFRPGVINLQRYVAGSGGYPHWHSELYPKPSDRAESLHRVLFWMVYLNDDFSAGETEFVYQARRVVPQTGTLLIAPAGFTHTHRGNRPQGRDKFIVTSWILFQRSEALYRDPQTVGLRFPS